MTARAGRPRRRISRAKRLLAGIACGFLAIVAVGLAIAWRDLGRAHERVQGRSEVVASPFGDIEYSQGGSGHPVLVIHGSGGGFDQGELFAELLFDERFHWITPSRYGYLRSTIPPGVTWDDQAHAYAHLLETLGLDRVAVVAISHGCPSALLMAVLHPQRVSSLSLISCGIVAAPVAGREEADRKGSALTRLFQRDLSYWLVSRLARRQFMELMGAERAIIDALTAEQLEWVERLIDWMNPVSLRAAGVVFDNRATLPGERIAAVRAPALILHAVDDTLQLYHNATFAASTIPGAQLVSFEGGGHLALAVERERIRSAVMEHVLAHAVGPVGADGEEP